MRLICRAFVLALALVPVAAAAQDAPQVRLHPGEQVSVKIAGDGQVAVVGGGAAQMTPFDMQALLTILRNYQAGMGRDPALLYGQTPKTLAPDVVRISFVSAPGPDGKEGRLLVLENGYGRALEYKAAIVRGTLAQVTDVCPVLPKVPGYEHWPYPIAEIDLSAMSLIQWAQGQKPTCQ